MAHQPQQQTDLNSHQRPHSQQHQHTPSETSHLHKLGHDSHDQNHSLHHHHHHHQQHHRHNDQSSDDRNHSSHRDQHHRGTHKPTVQFDPSVMHSLDHLSFHSERASLPHAGGRHVVSVEDALLAQLSGTSDYMSDHEANDSLNNTRGRRPSVGGSYKMQPPSVSFREYQEEGSSSRRASIAARPSSTNRQSTTSRVSQTAHALEPHTPAIESSIERAVYYDTINDAIAQGIEENRAMEIGQKARTRAREIHDRARQRIIEDQERIARDFMEKQKERERQEELQRKKQESDRLLAIKQEQQQINPTYAINSEHLSETIENLTPRWPENIHAPQHPHTNPPNHSTLTHVLKKIVSPAVRKGIREKIPDLMVQPRILHNKVNDIIDEFCHGMESEGNYRAREMLLAYRKSIETIETKTVARVAKEWEERANHTQYKVLIAKLEHENGLLKEQSVSTIALNVKLQREVEELRRDYSASSDEYKILVAENARRKLQCASYRRQLKRLREELADLECSSNSDKSDKSGDSSSSDDESDSCESDDSEWEHWCKETNFARPKWNKSTASKLLSAKPPPSVIHIGENPMAGYDDAHSEATKRGTSSAYSKSVGSDSEAESVGKRTKEQLKYKFHAKCNKKIQYLNQRILLIEAERAKATKIPVEKRQLMKELIELLQDCIESPKDNEHENNIANTLRLGSTTLSDTVDNPNPPEQEEVEAGGQSARKVSFMNNIVKKESLLCSLLSAITEYTNPQQSYIRPSRSPSPSLSIAKSTRSHQQSPKKARPSSASSRTTTATTTSTALGIKSIQVLLSEIDATHKPEEPQRQSPVIESGGPFARTGRDEMIPHRHSEVFFQKTLRDIYSDFALGDDGTLGENERKKPRPKSAPVKASVKFATIGDHEDEDSVALHPLPTIRTVKLVPPHSAPPAPKSAASTTTKTPSTVSETSEPSRWQRLSSHLRNPHAYAYPPRESIYPPSSKPRSVTGLGGGGVASKRKPKVPQPQPKSEKMAGISNNKWQPRPVDHTAGAHHGNGLK